MNFQVSGIVVGSDDVMLGWFSILGAGKSYRARSEKRFLGVGVCGVLSVILMYAKFSSVSRNGVFGLL